MNIVLIVYKYIGIELFFGLVAGFGVNQVARVKISQPASREASKAIVASIKQ